MVSSSNFQVTPSQQTLVMFPYSALLCSGLFVHRNAERRAMAVTRSFRGEQLDL
ncbi:hypothetical protein N657DRAFT_640573 [Parathielavia appendiculata]|uniref:Uncharacterized protein n=1 Tax=Parathielavia appendiculata TaxID=2587402 RepID=A0AAN6U5L6_9PEZI|nr:hypothetical protein N657DRAFT_640573 [Parathielavia appendiculata]